MPMWPLQRRVACVRACVGGRVSLSAGVRRAPERTRVLYEPERSALERSPVLGVVPRRTLLA